MNSQMNSLNKLTPSLLLFIALTLSTLSHSAVADPTHHISFKLTFANQDLTWFGDPASPASTAYLKPAAQPVATDVCVTTLTTSSSPTTRRYFHECRITNTDGQLQVLAFTNQKEKLIGTITDQGQFIPNSYYKENKDRLPSWPIDVSELAYDAQQNALYSTTSLPGPTVTESLDFLPLNLSSNNKPAIGSYTLDYTASGGIELRLNNTLLAIAKPPAVLHQADLKLNSYDPQQTTYYPDAAYRPGSEPKSQPCVTLTIPGQFTEAVDTSQSNLVLTKNNSKQTPVPATIIIDGKFDDWHNIPGVDDPRGDLVPYLEYIPDVDLLEFKVAHDDHHIYLYARVAGQVGRSSPNGGRSYFYAYMDVDQNPQTGFLPSRDDDCYFGVDIGDDCEVQFEFVDNVFRKTFYGFCGLGGNNNVLKQQVTIGRSQYGRIDPQGNERTNYKAEYTYRDGKTEITEDLKLGTSDSIHLAISPDGSQVEVVSAFTGFLKNPQGQPTLGPGQTIDLAIGMECDSKAYLHKKNWAADSTPAIRGYRLTPTSAK